MLGSPPCDKLSPRMLSIRRQEVSLNILQSLDQGCVSVFVLLDLSTAFDAVDHRTLLYHLEHWFGISGKSLSWMTSYLTDRGRSAHLDYLVHKDLWSMAIILH